MKKKPFDSFNKNEVMKKITPVLENIAIKLNLIILEKELIKESGKWFLRIYIYSAKHPITHKDCEDYTRAIDDYLDELIPVNYYLEVSSPGAERRLKSPVEYTIFKGKLVKIKVKELMEEKNEKVFEAIILNYFPEVGLTLLDKETGTELTIKEDNIFSVRLCLE